jgi:hypothetical protein
MLGRNGNIAYVRYDHQGRIVPGGPIIQAKPPKNGNWQAISNVIGTNYTGSSGSNVLRAFVRIDYFNRVVPSSLLLLNKEPGDANSQTTWLEINAQYRGDGNTTTTTTSTSSSTTSTTSTSTSTSTTTTTTTAGCVSWNACPEGVAGLYGVYICQGDTESQAISCTGGQTLARFAACLNGYAFWVGQIILEGPAYCHPVPDGWYRYGSDGYHDVCQVSGGVVVYVNKYA